MKNDGDDRVENKVEWCGENPWNVRLLDVRGITHEMISTTGDPTCAENAISFGGDDGTSFIGEEPENKRVSPANLYFRRYRMLADGVLFVPHEMEQKWALFYHGGQHGGQIICVRSWTRRVRALARVDVCGDRVMVTEVRGTLVADDEEPEYTVRALDYLLRSHVLDEAYPVPLPEGLEADPNVAALWCMSMFGNRAAFATPDRIDWVAPTAPFRTHSFLHIGAARGDRALIASATRAGVPADLLGRDGLPPLNWALPNEDPAIMALLLELGSPVDARSDTGATPLMAAVQGAHLGSALFLMDHGADVNAVDALGFTALHRAAALGHLDLAKLLLERGAKASPRKAEHTPLALARKRGQADIVALLRRHRGKASQAHVISPIMPSDPVSRVHYDASSLSMLDRVRGFLLGGAVGDALGAPVEFMSMEAIRSKFGQPGIREFAPAYGRLGAVTDDTQMTLFAAEGFIRACVRYNGRGICRPEGEIQHALLRWLHTQGEMSEYARRQNESWPDGWLVEQRELFSWRAPGMTCLSALRASANLDMEAQNDSKGCGAIMRIAPIGLGASLDIVYEQACESAKSTHAHPESTYSSGFFGLLIAQLMRGASLAQGIALAKAPLETDPRTANVLAAIAGAERLAHSAAPSTPELLETLGGGWVAEEALAISLFCAIRAESFEHAVRLAVNHGGDSDSTGSLTGQILGALGGAAAVPARWLEAVELRDIIEQLAEDLVWAAQGCADDGRNSLDSEGRCRYPGW
jgi:ADP-ribosylglycohydrolase